MRYQNIYEDIATGERVIPRTFWPSAAQAKAVAEQAVMFGMRAIGMKITPEVAHG